jgi:hypothetical protein
VKETCLTGRREWATLTHQLRGHDDYPPLARPLPLHLARLAGEYVPPVAGTPVGWLYTVSVPAWTNSENAMHTPKAAVPSARRSLNDDLLVPLEAISARRPWSSVPPFGRQHPEHRPP